MLSGNLRHSPKEEFCCGEHIAARLSTRLRAGAGRKGPEEAGWSRPWVFCAGLVHAGAQLRQRGGGGPDLALAGRKGAGFGLGLSRRGLSLALSSSSGGSGTKK